MAKDMEIIDLFWKRDESAIQELKSKYFGYCYKYALKLKGSLLITVGAVEKDYRGAGAVGWNGCKECQRHSEPMK